MSLTAFILTIVMIIVTAIGVFYYKKSADVSDEIEKTDKRKHNYKLINDRFNAITTNFSNIKIVGYKEKVFTGQKALHLLLTSGTLETMRNNLISNPNLKRLYYIIISLSKLIDDLNKLHEDDRKIVKESIVEFYDCIIQELVNVVLSNRNFLLKRSH